MPPRLVDHDLSRRVLFSGALRQRRDRLHILQRIATHSEDAHLGIAFVVDVKKPVIRGKLQAPRAGARVHLNEGWLGRRYSWCVDIDAIRVDTIETQLRDMHARSIFAEARK